MFRDAKVGEQVWDVLRGWGKVYEIEGASTWPIKVEFERGCSDCESYTYEGMMSTDDQYPALFWDEIVIKAPEKPVRLTERTFEGWANLYYAEEPKFHPTQLNAAQAAADNVLGTFPVRVIFSQVPEGFDFSEVGEVRDLNEIA